jgi:hypothetical protein
MPQNNSTSGYAIGADFYVLLKGFSALVRFCPIGRLNRALKTLLHLCTRVRVSSKDPAQYLPTSVQKSYFMLSRSARPV